MEFLVVGGMARLAKSWRRVQSNVPHKAVLRLPHHLHENQLKEEK